MTEGGDRLAGKARQDEVGSMGACVSRMVSRHEGLLKWVRGRATAPVRDLPIVNRSMPALGQRVSSIGRWSESVTHRVGDLAHNISGSLQGVVLRREMPGLVWFDRRRRQASGAEDRAVIGRSKLARDGNGPDGATAARADAGQPAYEDDEEELANASKVRGDARSAASDPLKMLDFAEAHAEKVDRQLGMASPGDRMQSKSTPPARLPMSKRDGPQLHEGICPEPGIGRSGASGALESSERPASAQRSPAGIDRDEAATTITASSVKGKKPALHRSGDADEGSSLRGGRDTPARETAPAARRADVDDAERGDGGRYRPAGARPGDSIGISRSRTDLVSRVAGAVKAPLAGMSRALAPQPLDLALRGKPKGTGHGPVEGDGESSDSPVSAERAAAVVDRVSEGRGFSSPAGEGRVSSAEAAVTPSRAANGGLMSAAEDESRWEEADWPEASDGAVRRRPEGSKRDPSVGQSPSAVRPGTGVAEFVSRMAARSVREGLSHLRIGSLSRIQRSAAAGAREGTGPEVPEGGESGAGAGREHGSLAHRVAAKYGQVESVAALAPGQAASTVKRSTGDFTATRSQGSGGGQEAGPGMNVGRAGGMFEGPRLQGRDDVWKTADRQRAGGRFGDAHKPMHSGNLNVTQESASISGGEGEWVMRAAHEVAGSTEAKAGAIGGGGLPGNGHIRSEALDLVLARMGEGWGDDAGAEHISLAASDRLPQGEAISRAEVEEEDEPGAGDVDLDGLARGVYPIVKRMLALERERMGCGRW